MSSVTSGHRRGGDVTSLSRSPSRRGRGPRRARWYGFFDEAGNTGTNHVDDTQPFYVLAGWVIAAPNVDRCRTLALDELSPTQKTQTEIKGSSLVRTVAGRARVVTLCERLGKAGAIPFFVGVHKRYSLAGRVVDYFFDPAYNPRVWPSWFETREIRKKFADELMTVPHEVLDQMQDVLRSGDVEVAERFVRELHEVVAASGNISLAQKIEGIVGRTAPAVAEMTAKDGPRSKGISPNHAAFAGMLQLLGGQAEVLGFQLIIVHDETSSFGATFREEYRALTTVDPDSPMARELHRSTPYSVPLVALEGLRFERSQDEALVQAADLLAAAVCWVLRGAGPSDHAETDRSLGLIVLGNLIHSEPKLGHIVESDQGTTDLARRLRQMVVKGG